MEHGQLAGRAAKEFQLYANRDHRAALQRKQLIEARKEFIENASKAIVSREGKGGGGECEHSHSERGG